MGRPPNFESVGVVIGSYMTSITQHAAERKIGVYVTTADLAEQWTRQEGRCALTGWPLSLKHRARDFTSTASLDRINSSLAYTPTNVQWVHKSVNRSKSNHTEEFFFEMCQAIVAYKENTVRIREGKRPWLKG